MYRMCPASIASQFRPVHRGRRSPLFSIGATRRQCKYTTGRSASRQATTEMSKLLPRSRLTPPPTISASAQQEPMSQPLQMRARRAIRDLTTCPLPTVGTRVHIYGTAGSSGLWSSALSRTSPRSRRRSRWPSSTNRSPSRHWRRASSRQPRPGPCGRARRQALPWRWLVALRSASW